MSIECKGMPNRETTTMTISQLQTVWGLCRQGFPLTADEAAARWEKGEIYEPTRRLRLTREVKQLIDYCNWEVDARARAA
jgi:hypothetical protein